MVMSIVKLLGMIMTGTNEARALVDRRINFLQEMLESNMHLKGSGHAKNVLIQIESVTTASNWGELLTDSEREYIRKAIVAVQDGKVWIKDD